MALKMEQLISIGILMIVIGFIIVFFGTFFSALKGKEASSNTKVAVGGFIGFIPFGFGNDKNLVWFATIISVVSILFWFIINYRIGK